MTSLSTDPVRFISPRTNESVEWTPSPASSRQWPGTGLEVSQGTAARRRLPTLASAKDSGVVACGSETLYIADRANHRVRKVDLATGIITTAAGNGSQSFGSTEGVSTTPTSSDLLSKDPMATP